MKTSITYRKKLSFSLQKYCPQLIFQPQFDQKKLLTLCLILFSLTTFAQSIEDFANQRQQEGQKKDTPFIKKKTINIYSLLFATNSATLTDKDKSSLVKEIIPYILRYPPSAMITVEGHTDDTGPSKQNLVLSQQRADSVQAFLITQGIDESRLVAKGYGEYQPISTKKTEEARRLNRRVALKIEDTGEGATIVMADGSEVKAKYLYFEPDGTISYTKSDTDPTVKIKRTEVRHIKYANGSSYNPNTGLAGTIQLKNGQQIPARMIAREPGFISYKKSDTDPIVKVRLEEVRSVKYADGSEYTPKVDEPKIPKEGLVAFREGKRVKAVEIKEEKQDVTYKVLTSDPVVLSSAPVVTTPKKELYYVRYPDGKTKYYYLPKFKFFEKLPRLTRFSAFVNAGVVPLTVKQANINFAYIDESPSKDNMQSIIQLQNRMIGYGGQVGGEVELDSSTVWRGYYQYAANSEGATSAVGFGIGKLLGRKKNKRIGVDLQFGSAYVKLGDLFQNDVFIQVNGSRFYSNSVALRYRNYFMAVHPYFSVEKALKNNFSLRLNVGLAAGLHTKSLITFKGSDNNGKSVKATEKLTEPNVTFIVDGEKSTSARLFGILGPQVSVAAYYTIYHRKAN